MDPSKLIDGIEKAGPLALAEALVRRFGPQQALHALSIALREVAARTRSRRPMFVHSIDYCVGSLESQVHSLPPGTETTW